MHNLQTYIITNIHNIHTYIPHIHIHISDHAYITYESYIQTKQTYINASIQTIHAYIRNTHIHTHITYTEFISPGKAYINI